MRTLLVCIAATVLVASTAAQQREPIIDVHMHAATADSQGPPPLGMCTPSETFPAWDPASGPYGAVFMSRFKQPQCTDPVWSPTTNDELMRQTIEVMERRDIIGVLSGSRERVDAWMQAAPKRFIPRLTFQIGDTELPSTEALSVLHAAGRLAVLGEVTNQYAGVLPADPRMEPYWAFAEKEDIPVGIHIGTGPPGVIYLGASDYRGAFHSALTLEEVLVRHPRLRVYVMHAGYPLLDDVLALLYAHPQVYVDVGIIVYSEPRSAFYRYLQAIVDAGFGNRVMLGSDQMVWPGVIERAISVIEDAPFLSQAQKRDIFYNNAARFLRLSKDDLARHRGR